MLNKIYIHYITTLFVLESFIISCWLLKGKKIGIGIGIGQFARKKSVSESATKNHDRCITSAYVVLLMVWRWLACPCNLAIWTVDRWIWSNMPVWLAAWSLMINLILKSCGECFELKWVYFHRITGKSLPGVSSFHFLSLSVSLFYHFPSFFLCQRAAAPL